MRRQGVLRIIGLFLTGYSLTLLPPVAVSLWFADGEVLHFLHAQLLSLGAGLALWLPQRKRRIDLRMRDGFLVVALFWTVLGLISAIPFLFSPHLDYVHAVFEAISGFTTTGATVIVGLDALPPSILYYRQQLQWLGGGGVVVLGVAIAPLLGVGGMQLYRAETPGPMKDDKLTPRIAHTARALWTIYLGLTAACAAAFWLCGMDLFDAVSHALSTISTGGFSTHDASFAHFDSALLEAVAVTFMLIGSLNFGLHFYALHQGRPGVYLRDSEVRAFLGLVAGTAVLIGALLFTTGYYAGTAETLRHVVFQVVSVITSTGYTTTDFSAWPTFAPVLLIFISFVGGCAGSTAGGMKVIRWLLLYRQGAREVTRLIHPKALIPVRIGGRTLPDRVVGAIWGFFSVYVITFAVLMLLMMATGVDQVTAFAAVATSLNNLGPGLGEVSANFASMNDFGIFVACIAMLLGRLEIFTILVLWHRAFWTV